MYYTSLDIYNITDINNIITSYKFDLECIKEKSKKKYNNVISEITHIQFRYNHARGRMGCDRLQKYSSFNKYYFYYFYFNPFIFKRENGYSLKYPRQHLSYLNKKPSKF